MSGNPAGLKDKDTRNWRCRWFHRWLNYMDTTVVYWADPKGKYLIGVMHGTQCGKCGAFNMKVIYRADQPKVCPYPNAGIACDGNELGWDDRGWYCRAAGPDEYRESDMCIECCDAGCCDPEPVTP